MLAQTRLALTGSLLIALCAGAPAQAAPQEPPEARLIELTNQARATAGCRPLVVDPQLSRSATGHAQDMARQDYFAHSEQFGGRAGPESNVEFGLSGLDGISYTADQSGRPGQAELAELAGMSGRTPGQRGGGRTAENIAAGKTTPEATFDQWISSDGHRQNIEDCRFTSVGIGHAFSATSRYGHYWVQEFAG